MCVTLLKGKTNLMENPQLRIVYYQCEEKIFS